MADQQASPETSETGSTTAEQVAGKYIGQWNRLISTTNWEKGRIICQWREAMMLDGMQVTEYSDEAWAQLVGGVTSQHVGRLRRVFQRFGDVYDQYEGLYWSHFQASLDWDDAEMWLEGSLQNDWSVSQMRGKRWETHGTPPEEQASEKDLEAAERDEEAQAEDALDTTNSKEPAEKEIPAQVNSTTTELKSSSDESEDRAESKELPASKPSRETQTSEPVEKRTRLQVDIELLPDDLAEAFESFKLAIIAHRREDWRDTTPESVVECLNALKELVMAESE